MSEFVHPRYGRLICAATHNHFGSAHWTLLAEGSLFTHSDLATIERRAAEAGARIIWPDSPGLAEIVKAETARDVLVQIRDGWGLSWGSRVLDAFTRAIALIDSGNAGGPT